MRCIHSFLPSNLAGYKSNNSCSDTTHKVARKGRLGAESRFGTESIKPALEAGRTKPRSDPIERQCEVVCFATAFLLMHVQGNQIAPVCLEEKQCCRRAEQRTQLAREVRIDQARTEQRRIVVGSSRQELAKQVTVSSDVSSSPSEPIRIIAGGVRGASQSPTTCACGET